MKNSIDLNLYRFLDSLYEQKSLAKVCHTLDISRATFNRYLSECRELFGNELFIADKGLYAPTLFTTQLINIIKAPLEQLEQAQQTAKSFNNKDANIEYIFHLANPLSNVLTVPLLQGLTQDGWHPKISIVDWALEGIEFPKSGALSIGISGYPNQLNERIIERKLGELDLFVYVSKQHPLACSSQISLSDLAQFDTVRVSMGNLDDNTYYERLRKQTGINLAQKLTISSVASAIECVEISQYAFVCFDILKNKLPINVCKLPLTLNNKAMTFSVGIQYHRAYYQHPIIKNIENLLIQNLESH
ncbi:LysR family transcriptional regulator [Aliivibrio fischeri]|uniref:LysR family transcriptional regulator n=1 Tax=Aliivibrio fischeri TaxID=668 RepID=UPI00080DB0A6|nr:LysR family transcriptional regulator [Aliivibrio fischeri]OCH08746.1 LysR family transcriptional regulator [Aliivibrio fischeri]